MKKLSLLIIVVGLLFSFQSFAQMRIGIKAGGNLSKMTFNIDEDVAHEPATKSKIGYHFGIITDIVLLKNKLSLQPELLYSNKGFSIDLTKELDDIYENSKIENIEGSARFNYNYIELPINFVYKNSGFQISFGPYVALGISGKYNQDFSFTRDGKEMEASDVFYEEDSYELKPVFGEVGNDTYKDFLNNDEILHLYRALDYGVNLGIGYQIEKVLLTASYSFGLNNLTPEYNADDYHMDEDYTNGFVQKNRVFSFSVSLFFN